MRLNRKKKAFYTILRAKVQKKMTYANLLTKKTHQFRFFTKKGVFLYIKKRCTALCSRKLLKDRISDVSLTL